MRSACQISLITLGGVNAKRKSFVLRSLGSEHYLHTLDLDRVTREEFQMVRADTADKLRPRKTDDKKLCVSIIRKRHFLPMQSSQTSRMKILGTHTSVHASVGIRRVTRAPDFSVYGRALVPRLPHARIYVCIYIYASAPRGSFSNAKLLLYRSIRAVM